MTRRTAPITSTRIAASPWSSANIRRTCQERQGMTHPFVDHNFYTTINVVRTIEALLGVPPMNSNDARAAVMAPLFGGDGTQPPFSAPTIVIATTA